MLPIVRGKELARPVGAAADDDGGDLAHFRSRRGATRAT